MGWGSYHEDNLDARGEAAVTERVARVLQRSKKSTEKVVQWIKDKNHKWLLLNRLPINAPYMNYHAVYIIWYFNENEVPVTVRAGIKNPKEDLIIMRNFAKVKKYADHDLYITWAASKSSDLERIWAYLCETLTPLESPRCGWVDASICKSTEVMRNEYPICTQHVLLRRLP